MRLIDADALIDELVNACNNDQSKFFPVWIEKQIDSQPTVAMLKEQEIVRCKDCKYYNSLMGHCKDGSSYPSPNWFCADGERKGT